MPGFLIFLSWNIGKVLFSQGSECSFPEIWEKFRYATFVNIHFQKYNKSSLNIPFPDIRIVPLCQGSEYSFPEI